MGKGKRAEHKANNGATLGFEQTLWLAADKLRNNMDAAEYKHVVLGRILPKHVSDAFEERRSALAAPNDEALKIRDDTAFFQAVRSALTKCVVQTDKPPYELDHAIRQIVSRAASSHEVIDIFTAAGLKRPDISILSDDFLAEVKGLPQKNLAVELLEKLLKDEIKIRTRKNLVQRRSFSEMLEASIRKYKARAIESAKVIEELIALAKEMRDAERREAVLGLSEDERAFYDALEVNDSAVKVLGDDTLKTIAHELVDTVRRNAIGWTIRENVRAKLRVAVRRILRKYGYPPDMQEKATDRDRTGRIDRFGRRVAVQKEGAKLSSRLAEIGGYRPFGPFRRGTSFLLPEIER